jgi:NitT/TauT family transport system permease protein
MVAKLPKPLKVLFIALFWFLIWEIASLLIGKRLLFPSPIDVTVRLAQLIITKNFLISCLYSLGRISFGIIIAIILGFITALLCHFSSTLYEILYPLVTVIKSTPVASFIILIWIFVGNSITPVFISALMVFPIVFANIYQGIKNVDKDLLEVCKVYNIPRKKMMKSLYVPSVVPYFLSALLSSIGLGWKAGIAAEVLCTPLNSIGKGIFEAKTYIEYVDLFAWTVTVIILSLVFELLLTKLIKKLFSKFTKKQVKSDGN